MFFFFFQAEDGIRDWSVTGVQTCALPISKHLAGREDAGTPRLRGLVPLDGAGALGADVAEHAQVDRVGVKTDDGAAGAELEDIGHGFVRWTAPAAARRCGLAGGTRACARGVWPDPADPR